LFCQLLVLLLKSGNYSNKFYLSLWDTIAWAQTLENFIRLIVCVICFNYIWTLYCAFTDFLHEYDITESFLKIRCEVSDLDSIADMIRTNSWTALARELDVSENNLNDNRHDVRTAREQRVQGLISWKSKQAFRATFFSCGVFE